MQDTTGTPALCSVLLALAAQFKRLEPRQSLEELFRQLEAATGCDEVEAGVQEALEGQELDSF